MPRATLGQGRLLFALSLTQLLGGGLHGPAIAHDAAAILHVAELASLPSLQVSSGQRRSLLLAPGELSDVFSQPQYITGAVYKGTAPVL